MKAKYRKYTNSYMKYIRFIHTEYKKNLNVKEILHRGYYGFWNHSDWDYPKTKREARMLGHYYDRLLGVIL